MNQNVAISSSLQEFLSADFHDRKNYLRVRRLLAEVMKCHLLGVPASRHYNEMFSRITDPNWKALVRHCKHDLAAESRCEDFLADEPELMRLYLILYSRGKYERICHVADEGLIAVKPPTSPSPCPQNIKLYNKEVAKSIGKYNSEGDNPRELARMMYSVVMVLQMKGIPSPHYDQFFSKLTRMQLAKLSHWLRRQMSQSDLSQTEEKICRGALMYLHFYTNQPDKFVLLYNYGLI